MSKYVPSNKQIVTVQPKSKRRNFAVYKYRDKEFLFTFKDGGLAVVSMIDAETNKSQPLVVVKREEVYKAARALMRIVEAEEYLDGVTVQSVPGHLI